MASYELRVQPNAESSERVGMAGYGLKLAEMASYKLIHKESSDTGSWLRAENGWMDEW